MQIFSLIPQTDIVSIKNLAPDTKHYMSMWCQTHYDVTDKNSNISFEGLHIHVTTSITAHPIRLTAIDTGNNVCLDLCNWHYSRFNFPCWTYEIWGWNIPKYCMQVQYLIIKVNIMLLSYWQFCHTIRGLLNKYWWILPLLEYNCSHKLVQYTIPLQT